METNGHVLALPALQVTHDTVSRRVLRATPAEPVGGTGRRAAQNVFETPTWIQRALNGSRPSLPLPENRHDDRCS